VQEMSKFFYPKLALNNIKKNAKTYIPYILTCIGTIMMFYNMRFIAVVKDMGNLSSRENLRSILYQISVIMVCKNPEMKKLYKYLKTREVNPLKKKQALVVIAKKFITIIHQLAKKQTSYKSELVFGDFRKKQITKVA
jgi:hypothetical protein